MVSDGVLSVEEANVLRNHINTSTKEEKEERKKMREKEKEEKHKAKDEKKKAKEEKKKEKLLREANRIKRRRIRVHINDEDLLRIPMDAIVISSSQTKTADIAEPNAMAESEEDNETALDHVISNVDAAILNATKPTDPEYRELERDSRTALDDALEPMAQKNWISSTVQHDAHTNSVFFYEHAAAQETILPRESEDPLGVFFDDTEKDIMSSDLDIPTDQDIPMGRIGRTLIMPNNYVTMEEHQEALTENEKLQKIVRDLRARTKAINVHLTDNSFGAAKIHTRSSRKGMF